MSNTLQKLLRKVGAETVEYKLNDPYIIEVSGTNALPGDTRSLSTIVADDIYRTLLDEFISRIEPHVVVLNERIHKLSLLGHNPPTKSFKEVVDAHLAPYAHMPNFVYRDQIGTIYHNFEDLTCDRLHQTTGRTGQYVVYCRALPFTLLLDEENPLEIVRDSKGYVATIHYDMRIYAPNIRAFYITCSENEFINHE